MYKRIPLKDSIFLSDLKYYLIWNTITCLLLLVYPPTLLQGDKNLFQREIFITCKRGARTTAIRGKKDMLHKIF